MTASTWRWEGEEERKAAAVWAVRSAGRQSQDAVVWEVETKWRERSGEGEHAEGAEGGKSRVEGGGERKWRGVVSGSSGMAKLKQRGKESRRKASLGEDGGGCEEKEVEEVDGAQVTAARARGHSSLGREVAAARWLEEVWSGRRHVEGWKRGS